MAGGGALFGDMLASLRDIKADGDTDATPITHGRCSGVGLSAYLMGGGWALDSAHAGMGCDRVQKVEIVLADGRVVIASANDGEHQDLFWAVRGGGGGNLGFATKWWLNPLRVQKVMAFNGIWRLTATRMPYSAPCCARSRRHRKMGAEMTVSTTSTTFGSPWRYVINALLSAPWLEG